MLLRAEDWDAERLGQLRGKGALSVLAGAGQCLNAEQAKECGRATSGERWVDVVRTSGGRKSLMLSKEGCRGALPA